MSKLMEGEKPLQGMIYPQWRGKFWILGRREMRNVLVKPQVRTARAALLLEKIIVDFSSWECD